MQGHGPADDLRIRAEAPLPQAVAQHDYALGVGDIFRRKRRAPDRGLDAHNSEEFGRDARSPQSLRVGLPLPLAAREVEASA